MPALINLKNKYARRALLIVAVVPLFFLSLLYAIYTDALLPLAKEMPDVFRDVWRGK